MTDLHEDAAGDATAASTGSSDAELDRAIAAGTRRAPLHFRRIVVIGGGCYGSWYTQQLTRATQRGALVADDVVVVDRDAQCLVAQRHATHAYAGLPVRVVVESWHSYLADWLHHGADALAAQALVPSPLMPHLCLDWLIDRARARWPDRTVRVEPLPQPPDMPWQRAAPDGRHYVSFATWMCPVNCIEPARCPETRGARDWSLPSALERYVKALPVGAVSETAVASGNASQSASVLHGPVIFHCTHRTYGVGMIDAADIVRADGRIAAWGQNGPVAALVGTVSHCHGALGILVAS